MSALAWLTLMNLSGAASLHNFRAEPKDFSTSSLFMSGVYLAILHAGDTHKAPGSTNLQSAKESRKKLSTGKSFQIITVLTV